MRTWTFNGIVTAVLAAIIAAINQLFGGWDDSMTILVILVSLDYVLGWVRAFVQKELSSDQSFRGIAKKVLLFGLVVVAAQIDRLLGTAALRYAVIVFYCANESLSILENAVAAGLPVPGFLKAALKQLNERKFPEETPPPSG